MEKFEVHAATDITGFGLLGHARELAIASGVTLEIEPARVQFLDGALEYARAGAIPAGLKNNRDFVAGCLEGASEFEDLLCDPQTSGGLLISISEPDAARFTQKLPAAYRIGRVLERRQKPILIK